MHSALKTEGVTGAFYVLKVNGKPQGPQPLVLCFATLRLRGPPLAVFVDATLARCDDEVDRVTLRRQQAGIISVNRALGKYSNMAYTPRS
eukprot:412462-Heterocapsa_arctica.AAC.1